MNEYLSIFLFMSILKIKFEKIKFGNYSSLSMILWIMKKLLLFVMIIFFRLNSSFFSIFFNGYPLRLGKISSQRPGTLKRGLWLCQDGKTDISSCFFPFSAPVSTGSSIVPGAKATTWYPEKEEKKRQVRELVKRKSFAESWMLSLHNWSIRFWLRRFLLSAGETLLNFASCKEIFLIFIRTRIFWV